MKDAGFIIGCYLLTFGAIFFFALFTLRKARKLDEQVNHDEKPWT